MKLPFKFLDYIITDKDVNHVRVNRLDKYTDKQLNQICLEFMEGWRNKIDMCKCLKTLRYLENNYPNSEYILKTYRQIKQLEYYIDTGYFKYEYN